MDVMLQYGCRYCDYKVKKFTECLEKGQNKLTEEELEEREEPTQATK
ncbi:2994_t:CDS:1, partial [Gigaspora rosea]